MGGDPQNVVDNGLTIRVAARCGFSANGPSLGGGWGGG